jgi:DNA-binding SARP family transcriptional activator
MAGLRSVGAEEVVEHLWRDEATSRLEQLGAHVPAAWMKALDALMRARHRADDAQGRAREALAAAQAVGCPGAQATSLAALGAAEHNPGHLRAARALADEAGVTFRPWEVPASRSARHQNSRLVPCEARLFGGFDLFTFGHRVCLSDLRPRVRQLLHILVLHAGEPLHRERLAEMLWPEADPDLSVHRLQVAVSSLRRLLDAESGLEGEIVQRDGLSYVLRLPQDSVVDVQQFTQALARARVAHRDGRDDETITALQAAVDLHHGDLLPEDGPAEWVAETRESLRTEAAAASALLARLLATRDPRAALEAAERAVGLDHYNDEAWHLLIHLHRHLGDTAMAQRTTSMYQEVLRDLGVSPGATRA